MSLLPFVLSACLINRELYEERKAELAEEGHDTGVAPDPDADADGYAESEDCDDDDVSVHPEAVETCDDRDEDCDGEIDEEATDAETWYLDQDRDGFGDSSESLIACDAPEYYAPIGTDCDDGEREAYPGAEEIACDGIDNDCSGGDLEDADNDGWDICGVTEEDCDDSDSTVHPDADEGWLDDGIDNDCDGQRYDDLVWTLSEALTRIDGPVAGGEFGRRLGFWEPGACLIAAASYEEDTTGAVDAEVEPSGVQTAGSNGVVWGSSTGMALSGIVAANSVETLALSEPNYGSGAGRAYLLDVGTLCEGAQGTVDELASSSIDAEGTGHYLGSDGTWLPDVDGDGVEDLAIVAIVAAGPGVARGAVYIWYSPPADGTAANAADADVAVFGDADGSYLGTVRAATSTDGAGPPDLLFGETATSAGSNVVIRLRGEDLATGAVGDVAAGSMISYSTGASPTIAVVGDTDNDGEDNVVAGVYSMCLWSVGDFEGTVEEGSARTTFSFTDEGDWLTGFAGLEDADGDDRDELVLLAEDWHDGAEQGMLGILAAESLDPYGDNDLSDVRIRASGQEEDDSFAYRVQSVGDLDSDGRDDLAVSAYGTDFGGTAAGSVVLLPLPF